MRPTLLFAALALAGCATTQTVSGPEGSSPAPTTARAEASGPSDAVPHFIEDDYAGALAQARAQNKPLFVEAWAPW